ncbi:DUF805 domain-containing protein [bacterium]|nr:DUF805 domain-containing protein [bacterium]
MLSGLVVIVFFLPTLSLTVRRLHDIGKSGWWLFGLYIGAPVFMVFSMLWESVGLSNGATAWSV